MKLGLKDKIQTTINGYKANCKEQGESIQAVLEPFKVHSYAERFTQEGLRQTIKEQLDVIHSDWKKYDTVLNQQIRTMIAAAKEELMKALNMTQVKKSDDYAVRIANAREFLKMELDSDHADMKELDSALYLILKDFVDDYDTMKLFSKMIEKKFNIYDAITGESTLPKTFGKMMKVDSIMNTLNEVDEASTMIFLHARTDSQEVIRIKGDAYAVPMDGYAETVDEQSIIDNATILDDLADNIDADGQSSSSGEGQNIE